MSASSHRAVVAGPDPDGIAAALESRGATVTRVDGVVTGDTLADAGIADATLYVLTDAAEATSIAVAKERNPDVRAVVYGRDSLPEFAAAQTDLAVDPDLLGADVVAEELTA